MDATSTQNQLELELEAQAFPKEPLLRHILNVEDDELVHQKYLMAQVDASNKCELCDNIQTLCVFQEIRE